MNAITRVAVIGAGVMGGGIAAQLANAGAHVLLLDIADGNAPDRSAPARNAIERLIRSTPPAFMHRSAAARIDPGNLEDDLVRVAEVDWIIEAVVERIEVKRDLYARLDAVRRPGTIVSSNTSTIPLARLVEGASASLQQDFAITHFFNPPRYMRLLEIVQGSATRPDLIERLRNFADLRLGKGVVECKDTPGFIANRIGVYWLQCAVAEAIAATLSVEQADAVLGPAAGIPKTGVFGLIDLIGLDLMPHVIKSMDALLPATDALRRYMETPDVLAHMIARGDTGRKGGGGFYRMQRVGSQRIKESIDLATGAYRRSEPVRPACVAVAQSGGLRALVEHDSDEGRYAWRVLSSVLAYSVALVPEISDDIADIDAAMRLGYNWRAGPFEMADQLGVGWFSDRLRAENRSVAPMLEAALEGGFYRTAGWQVERIEATGGYTPVVRPPGIMRLADAKRSSKRVIGNDSASVWDIGRDLACLEFHTGMNTLDSAILQLIAQTVALIPGRFAGLIIYNDAEHFSAGVNLDEVLSAIDRADWERLTSTITCGQSTFKAMKYAPFPIVGAPAGMALGGGCEILLHCDAIVAHAETYTGLVETGVGLIPAWGGCKELLTRLFHSEPNGPMPPVNRAFEIISLATVSGSASEARESGILRPGDTIVMNRDRVLAEAVDTALTLARGYMPPEPPGLKLPGAAGRVALELGIEGFVEAGRATPHDVVIARALARILTGGDTDLIDDVDEDTLLGLEREAVSSLMQTTATRARIAHMLATGRPLRN